MAEIAAPAGSMKPQAMLAARSVLWLVLCLAVAAILFEIAGWPREEHFRGPFPESASQGSEARAPFIRLNMPALLSCCLTAGADSNAHPRQSHLGLWINGNQVGPPHQQHDAIRRRNTSGFSHWSDYVIFSLPLGVENTSATSVTIRYSLRPQGYLVSLLVLASGLLGFAAYRRLAANSVWTVIRWWSAAVGSLRTLPGATRTLIVGVTPRSVERCIRLLVALMIILIGLDLGGYFDRSGVIQTSTMQPLQGSEYLVPDIAGIFPRPRIAALFYAAAGDSLNDPETSGLRLFENVRPLGPPHSAHQGIAEHGEGRYSHWIGQLRFSASDNSDPRINGRVYTAVEGPAIWRLLFVPGLLLVPLVGWRQRHGLAQGLVEIRMAIGMCRSDAVWFALTGTLAAYIVGYYIVGAPPVPLIAPDSTSYWSGSGIRTVGYPIFLWTVYGLFGSLKAIVIVQIAVFAAAVITVQFGIRRITGSPVVAGITAVVLLIVGNVASTAIWLLTESLMTSLILFHVAAAACALKRPTWPNLAMLALTAVLASAVRPAAYFLFGGIVFLALFWRGRRRIILRRAVVSLIAFTLVYYGVDEMVRGQAGQSIAGLALFPHVANLYDGPPPAMSAEMAAAIASPALDAYKLERARTPHWEDRQLLEQANFNLLLNDLANRVPLSLKELDKLLLSLSYSAIRDHPFGYMAVVAENMGEWAKAAAFATPPFASRFLIDQYLYQWDVIANFYQDKLGKEPEVSLSDLKDGYYLTGPSEAFPAFAVPLGWRTPIKITFFMITVLAVVCFVLGYGGTAIAFAAYVGVLMFGGALLISLSTVFILRYAIPLDPLVLIVVIVGCWRALVRIAEPLRGWLTMDCCRSRPDRSASAEIFVVSDTARQRPPTG